MNQPNPLAMREWTRVNWWCVNNTFHHGFIHFWRFVTIYYSIPPPGITSCIPFAHHALMKVRDIQTNKMLCAATVPRVLEYVHGHSVLVPAPKQVSCYSGSCVRVSWSILIQGWTRWHPVLSDDVVMPQPESTNLLLQYTSVCVCCVLALVVKFITSVAGLNKEWTRTCAEETQNV